MSNDTVENSRRPTGLKLTLIIIGAALLTGLFVSVRITRHPRTDDAEVLANYIEIAPQVEGPLVHLFVRDNELVRKGDPLFEVDSRPYQYALEQAISDQATLEGEISDEARRIAALESAVRVSQAKIQSATADVNRWSAAIDQAQADVTNAGQGVSRALAEWIYSSNNLGRLKPLLTEQFVTVDQVDEANSLEAARRAALRQAESQLNEAQAALKSINAQWDQAVAILEESQAQHEQSKHAVTTLEPLVNQRGAKAAAVETARYNLNNCRVYAPFDARVTNLTISEGEYAHIGGRMFVLIDTRRWWVVANFREGQIPHLKPGMRADVYVMSKPDRRFAGYIDSLGFGVTPDSDVIGSFRAGLPDVQRTLNWVHLTSRYPVRVRIENPEPNLFRISESAVVIVRGR